MVEVGEGIGVGLGVWLGVDEGGIYRVGVGEVVALKVPVGLGGDVVIW